MNTFLDIPLDQLKKIFEYQPKKERLRNSLNIFSLISKKYYHEDFHSDIIASLLCPNKNPHYGKKLMNYLVNCINQCIDVQEKKCSPISGDIFLKNYKVFREKFKIDLLITNEDTKTAIII